MQSFLKEWNHWLFLSVSKERIVNIFLVCLLGIITSSCVQVWNDAKVISLYAKDTSGIQTIRGSWYMSGKFIFTSAHVVPDDRWIYFVSGSALMYKVHFRDIYTDRAILASKNISNILLPVFSGSYMPIWAPVYSLVFRSGSVQRLDGKVVWTGDILWYTQEGKSFPIKWISLTDIEFLPWESWSPIFDTSWNLIDVVHVR